MMMCKFDDENSIAMQTNKENTIVSLTFNFAIDIVVFTEILESNKRFNLANQLFKSGTSIGANVREAQNAESKQDFIHKMKIAAKEADETEYWLQICNQSENYPNSEKLIESIISIQKVLSKIISSSKSKT